jgi:hypothetical protein
VPHGLSLNPEDELPVKLGDHIRHQTGWRGKRKRAHGASNEGYKQLETRLVIYPIL